MQALYPFGHDLPTEAPAMYKMVVAHLAQVVDARLTKDADSTLHAFFSHQTQGGNPSYFLLTRFFFCFFFFCDLYLSTPCSAAASGTIISAPSVVAEEPSHETLDLIISAFKGMRKEWPNE
jgi:hypothetical protein